MTRILGIDPSLTSTGLALVEGGQVLQTERIRSRNKGHERIDDILVGIQDIIAGGPKPIVGIEGCAFSAKGSAIVQIFGLWGIITHQLHRWGMDYYVIPPTSRMLYGAGSGRASKDEVLAAVVRRYLDVDVTGNDVADALIVAAMGARHYGEPLEPSMPAANLKAMDKVEWA